VKTILFFSLNPTENLDFYDEENYNIIHEIDYNIDTVLNTFNDIKENHEEIYFCSDNIEFLVVIYRLYTQLFDAFIYQSSSIITSFNPEPEYQIFLKIDILDEEDIFVPIYCLQNIPTNISINIDFKKIDSAKSINSTKKEDFIEKVYYFDNKYLLTTGLSLDLKIITLDNSLIQNNIDITSAFININSDLISYINYIIYVLTNSTANSETSLNKIKIKIEKLIKKDQLKLFIILRIIIKAEKNPTINTFINSFLICFNSINEDFFKTAIDEVMTSESMSLLNKYYLFWQYMRVYFITQNIQNTSSQFNLAGLYRNVYNDYKNSLDNLSFIPKEKRNQDLIFIFTGQLLGSKHAPTKLLLERAYHLIKNFNKNVLILNTKELITKEGQVPFFQDYLAYQKDYYSDANHVTYKGLEIPFYQPSSNMPNEEEIKSILSIVQEYKPYFILSIGSANLTADLCSNIVPTVAFPTTSDLPISESQILINRTELSSENRALCKDLNIDEKSIIISNPKGRGEDLQITYTKKEFDLPENKFLISVVGNRLEDEISNEFILMLLNTIKENTFIVFIGVFENYAKLCNQFLDLKNNSIHLPFQNHLNAVLKLFDLNVNPDRIGGAHGALYSIMHSIPIVTINRGDTHVLTTNHFSVTSYKSMQKIIKKYINDPIFYKKQSELAYQTYLKGSNTEEEISLLLSDIEKNHYFL